jgi:hypothetical protein
MVTVKKGITKANKYTKKRGRLIHNNSNSNNTKILHNFYKSLFKTKKDLALLLTPERNSNAQFLEYIYKQLNSKQLIINALAIEKSRTSEENKSIIVNKITSIVNNHLRSSKYIDSELINFIFYPLLISQKTF